MSEVKIHEWTQNQNGGDQERATELEDRAI